MRRALPDRCPLFVRISATDWTEGGWDVEQSVELARRLKGLGVDVIDCSSGGNVEKAKVPVGPGYQVPFAERIRREADIATAAVGMITASAQADQIVRNGEYTYSAPHTAEGHSDRCTALALAMRAAGDQATGYFSALC